MRMRILPAEEKERFSMSVDSNLIRTGSVADGACFFYSMNLAFRDFREATAEEKKEFIENQRTTLAEELSLEDWMSINDGHFCFLQLLYTIRNAIFILHYLASGKSSSSDKERWIADWGDCVEDDSFEIWTQFFPLQMVDNELFNSWHNQLSQSKKITLELISSSLKELCSQHLDKRLENFGKQEEKNSLKEGMYEFWANLVSKCIHKSLFLQKQRIANYSTWADMDTILSISPYLPYHLIFIHAESKEIYFDTTTISGISPKVEQDDHDEKVDKVDKDDKDEKDDKENEKDEKEVVLLLYYPDCHFENVGRIVANEDGKQKIIRVFPNDSFIQKLRCK